MGSVTSLISKRRLLLLLVSGAIVVALGVLAAFGVRALAPRPRPVGTPTSMPLPVPSILLSPQEVEPGELIVVTGEGWQVGDEVSVDVIAPSGDQRYVPRATVAEDGSLTAAFFFPSESPWSGLSSATVRVSSAATGDGASAVVQVAGVVETPPPAPTATATSAPVETPTPATPPTDVPTGTPAPTAGPTGTPTRAPVVVPTPTSTPAILGWRGEYFDNRFLTGSPVLVRDDASVNFTWGTGAPSTALPADAFSARWTRTVPFQSGTYRFYVTSDDGVRVWLDGVLIVDQWRDASAVTYTADRTLGAGNHTLRVEYYENTGTAQIQVWWERLGDFPQWRGEYFPRPDPVGTPTLVRNDVSLSFEWGGYAPAIGLPPDGFSARWTRSLWFDEGLYRFHAVVDDGVRLYVDDTLIIDSWRDGGRRELTADRRLTTGNHAMRVEYYERTGDALIQVWWEKLALYPDWKGEYWSNRTLSGSPVLVRNDAAIDFAWGGGAPATGLPADGFSARWTRTADFDAATYRFQVRVDDGARLWVDDRLIIDTWRDGAVRDVSADLALARGTHHLRLEYYERTGEARVRVRWEKVAASYPDWKGEYWSNRKLEGKPALMRNDKGINFDWGDGAVAVGLPKDDFSARWSRNVTFERGVYRFRARADDGIRVTIDGKVVLDEWHLSDGDDRYTVDLNLTGQKAVVVEYYDRGGKAMVDFSWKRIGDWPMPTPTPTATPTVEPTGTPTVAPTATPTTTPDPTATPTVTPSPTVKPTATPTVTPTATPTVTPSPTAKPSATPTVTPTSTPTAEPVTTTVRLNEILPVPAQDGVIDEFDEWIELTNVGLAAFDLTGWFLDDGAEGSEPYQISEGTVLPPGAFVLFRGRTTVIVLDDAGDEVRLLDPAGDVVDAVVFGELPPNASYSRDDIGTWHDDWPPSPGGPNVPPSPASLTGIERLNLRLRGRGPQYSEPKRIGGPLPW